MSWHHSIPECNTNVVLAPLIPECYTHERNQKTLGTTNSRVKLSLAPGTTNSRVLYFTPTNWKKCRLKVVLAPLIPECYTLGL